MASRAAPKLGDLSLPEDVRRRIERAVEVIRSVAADARVLLFGSFARGDWLEESDIDLLVISDAFGGMSYLERLARIKRALLENGLPRVHVIPLTRGELEMLGERSVVISDALEYAVEVD